MSHRHLGPYPLVINISSSSPERLDCGNLLAMVVLGTESVRRVTGTRINVYLPGPYLLLSALFPLSPPSPHAHASFRNCTEDDVTMSELPRLVYGLKRPVKQPAARFIRRGGSMPDDVLGMTRGRQLTKRVRVSLCVLTSA